MNSYNINILSIVIDITIMMVYFLLLYLMNLVASKKSYLSLCIVLFLVNSVTPFFMSINYNELLINYKIYHTLLTISGLGCIYWSWQIILSDNCFARWISASLFFPYMFILNNLLFSAPFKGLEQLLTLCSVSLFLILYYNYSTKQKGKKTRRS